MIEFQQYHLQIFSDGIMPNMNPINWIFSTSLQCKNFCQLLIFCEVHLGCVHLVYVLIIAKAFTKLDSECTTVRFLLLATNPRMYQLSRQMSEYYTDKLSSSHRELKSGFTSCNSFSLGATFSMQCMNSICSLEERIDIIQGKKSSNSVTGILHMNCQMYAACFSEENCCISSGNTCPQWIWSYRVFAYA